jgi:hypothetical protein
MNNSRRLRVVHSGELVALVEPEGSQALRASMINSGKLAANSREAETLLEIFLKNSRNSSEVIKDSKEVHQEGLSSKPRGKTSL